MGPRTPRGSSSPLVTERLSLVAKTSAHLMEGVSAGMRMSCWQQLLSQKGHLWEGPVKVWNQAAHLAMCPPLLREAGTVPRRRVLPHTHLCGGGSLSPPPVNVNRRHLRCDVQQGVRMRPVKTDHVFFSFPHNAIRIRAAHLALGPLRPSVVRSNHGAGLENSCRRAETSL